MSIARVKCRGANVMFAPAAGDVAAERFPMPLIGWLNMMASADGTHIIVIIARHLIEHTQTHVTGGTCAIVR